MWSTDGTTHLCFEYCGDPVKLDTGKIYNIPSRMKYYGIIAGWMIEDYIDEIEWQKSAEMKLEKAGDERRIHTDA